MDTRLKEKGCENLKTGWIQTKENNVYEQFAPATIIDSVYMDETKTQTFKQWIAPADEVNFDQLTAQFADIIAQYRALIAAQDAAYAGIMANFGDTAQQAYDAFTDALAAFRADVETDVDAWFQDYTSTLGPDEAVQLFNKQYAHEHAEIAAEQNGVHGLRFHENKLQVKIRGGWVSLLEVVLGLRWEYLNTQSSTWQEWQIKNLSWGEFENMMEEEQ